MELKLFTLNAGRDFGQRVADALGVPLSPHEEREFEDGEHKARPLENVRGRDVYVVHSLYGDARQSVNDKLVRLLFFLGALKDASAGRLTAVIPYLCYARKDRRTKSRDPVSSRYIAAMLETCGADRVVTLDVHNVAAYENAFRIRTDHLEARKLFAEHFASVVGDVSGRTVVIIDDLISSGTTIARAVAACHANGARRIHAAASHGLFMGKAGQLLADPALGELVVTDTVPPLRLDPAVASAKLKVLSVAPLFAEAIRRMHTGGSIVELLEP